MARNSEKTPANRQTLTVDEVCVIMGIGRNQAYEAVHRGELPSIKIGKRILVPKAGLEKLLGSPLPASMGNHVA